MTPLVLLPGLMCDARLFAPQIETFSAQRTIVVPCLAREETVEAMARSVLAQAPPRFALAGLSMGGIVAMSVIALSPERVAGLALLDTNPLAEDEAVRARRGPQIEAARAGGLERVMREEMKPRYLAAGPAVPAILDRVMEMARALGPEAFARQSIALRDRPDRRDALRAYSAPALVLCGAEDRLCPPERHRLIAELLPDAVLEIVENAGHLSTLERPDAVNAALTRWLARL